MTKLINHKNKCLNSYGFSLIELSIVTVIIGLLIAGIAAGTSLSETAKLNSTITIEQHLQTAIVLFQSNYGSLPGDFPNASSFWPSANCVAGDTNIDQSLCDGNNNGIWGGYMDSGDCTAEGTRALQHMQSAGLLIGGQYVGGNRLLLIGTNVVAVPLYTDIGLNLDSGSSGTDFVNGNFFLSPKLYFQIGNFIVLSGPVTFNGQPGATAITPAEASYIDNKIDDGVASKGNVLSYSGYPYAVLTGAGPCTNTVNNVDVYNLSVTDRVCTMGFIVPN